MNTSDMEGVKTKVCSKCKIEKPVEEFPKDSSKRDGLHNECKGCRKERKVRYNKANSEKQKEYQKEYRKSNPDKIKEYQKDYRKANSDKLKEYDKEHYKKHSDKMKDSSRNWHKVNVDRSRAATGKRRAKKLGATPPWLTKEHLSVIRNFYTESKALEKATGIKHHVDHIVPLQGENVCGLHVPWNLQVLTASENIAKSSNYPDEWEDT
jgi:hypothetical protein